MERAYYRVLKDRFHLTDHNMYILQGTWPRGAMAEAYVDQTALPVETVPVSYATAADRFRDEARDSGGMIQLYITLPEESSFARLRVYYRLEGGYRQLWYEISGKKLNRKRNGPQFYIEKEIVGSGLVHVAGWTVDNGTVEISLLDDKNELLEAGIVRSQRADVEAVFSEAGGLTQKVGFLFEIPKPKGSFLSIRFACEGRESFYTVNLTPGRILVSKGLKYAHKANHYLRSGGWKAFWIKVREKYHQKRLQALPYPQWLPRHLPSARELASQRKQTFDFRPTISLVVPVYRTPAAYLKRMIESIQAQTYDGWELCLSDGSGPGWEDRRLLEEYAARDSRIHVIPHERALHIAPNTNAAIEKASGDYLGFLDHDDELTPNALYEMVRLLNRHPEYQLIYSDEDKVMEDGREYFQPHFKSDYNEHLLCSVNYICHFLLVSRELASMAGPFREEYDGAQDYDFILRCTEKLTSSQIGHVPKILYHWRAHASSTAENPESKRYAFEAGKRALEDHYRRIGVKATVEHGEFLGLYRTHFIRDYDPLVSILIPNKDHIEDLKRCMDSIDRLSTYRNYEYIIIENNSEKEETFLYYKQLEASRHDVHVVYWDGPFNFASINNFAVPSAKGEYLLLLNNDTEVISPDFMEEMLGFCMEEKVGAVGARLYYEDDTIQHAGVVIGFGGIAGHCFVMQPRSETGYMHRIICTCEYSAVTAACMMVKKKAYLQVGGLTEELAVAFNDIDFCLKLRKEGYLVVYAAYAQLYHYESKSRGLEDTPQKLARFNQEIAIFDRRWPQILQDGDPYYNPNLTLESQDFSLRRM